MRVLRGIAIAALVVICGFVPLIVAFAIWDHMSDTQFMAHRAGTTIEKCVEIGRAMGFHQDEADRRCTERVPKVKR